MVEEFPGEVGARPDGVSGQVEAEAFHPYGVPGAYAAVECGVQLGGRHPEAAVLLRGRQAAQQQAGRARGAGQGERDEQVEFVQGVDRDQAALERGQAQQGVALGRSGDDEVLAAYAVAEGFAQFRDARHVHARAVGGAAFRPDGCLVGLLRVVHAPGHPGVVEGGAEGGEVGVEAVREQEVEGTVEGVGQFVQQAAVHDPVGARVGVGGQRRYVGGAQAGHRHSATCVPSPWSRASWAKRWPRAMSVTTSPLL